MTAIAQPFAESSPDTLVETPWGAQQGQETPYINIGTTERRAADADVRLEPFKRRVRRRN